VRLVPSILRCLASDSLVGSWIVAFYIFVLDHDTSISGFGLRLKDFSWNTSFLVEVHCNSISGDLVRLRTQVLGYSIS
jgi:hypothetical protein